MADGGWIWVASKPPAFACASPSCNLQRSSNAASRWRCNHLLYQRRHNNQQHHVQQSSCEWNVKMEGLAGGGGVDEEQADVVERLGVD